MLREAEYLVFEVLCGAHPNFAGPGIRWENGPDPPDFVGTDQASGRRIGVELGEWLNEAQMRGVRRQERVEDSFLMAIRSEGETPPENIGRVWLSLKHEEALLAEEAGQFRAELFQCIHAIDLDWNRKLEGDNPQGYTHADFSSFPCLQRHLGGIEFQSALQIPAHEGISWVGFPPRGAPYTPKPAVDALLNLLEKKARKYAGLCAAVNLDELCLVAYWNQGLIYNTPFFAPGFGFDDVARLARKAVAGYPMPFQQVFLFNALPQDLDLARIYPAA